eukprot:NODE_3023_length_715_cov_74.463964_g2132_i0.p4 GENE.NODE_3023_length_715_cov_74.463964_g2132_i0~~NODE_3023_length_715_cov_74.463964_g2132_i0.p4  ORF type:complete len:75 (-),score=20.55 NODE_3023_length_715_cov_74.463964_g2132_i0:459-683(-)
MGGTLVVGQIGVGYQSERLWLLPILAVQYYCPALWHGPPPDCLLPVASIHDLLLNVAESATGCHGQAVRMLQAA